MAPFVRHVAPFGEFDGAKWRQMAPFGAHDLIFHTTLLPFSCLINNSGAERHVSPKTEKKTKEKREDNREKEVEKRI